MIGFCGKLPSHGDFLSRHLDQSFATTWNEWLLNVLNVSKAQLGDNWLNHFLVSPIWRFALNPGICGTQGATGILMPSVDSVGRYYPLTIGSSTGSTPTTVLEDHDDWYAACEQLALSTLEDAFTFDEFQQRISKLAPLPSRCIRPKQSICAYNGSQPTAITMETGGGGHLISDVFSALADDQFRMSHRNYSLWWTSGGENFPATLLVCEGLPPVGQFSGLLDGQYAKWGWQAHQILQIAESKSPRFDQSRFPVTQ